ncbi:hypothetical protein [uncultured Imperialibacter sp.]|uniref:hypothetical protein n=1 Tax=uncultured Imperialibacter sp. TaxID=1672639 RepID=UPI0030DC1519|tara:strand:+ start:32892 stop:33476 length:585 start_codon:yes stop_codon:yes gene_type:complete
MITDLILRGIKPLLLGDWKSLPLLFFNFHSFETSVNLNLCKKHLSYSSTQVFMRSLKISLSFLLSLGFTSATCQSNLHKIYEFEGFYKVFDKSGDVKHFDGEAKWYFLTDGDGFLISFKMIDVQRIQENIYQVLDSKEYPDRTLYYCNDLNKIVIYHNNGYDIAMALIKEIASDDYVTFWFKRENITWASEERF